MASLKLIHEVDTAGPISQLSRMNNIVLGFDNNQSILEIDIKHQLLIRNKIDFPPTSIRCLRWEGRMQYFVTLLDRIQLFQGNLVSQSNLKAQFTGLIDSLNEGLLFSKYHKNYKKHSINYWSEGAKKVLKLSDDPYSKLIFNPCTGQVIYSLRDSVNCFDLANPEKETALLKKSSFLHDDSYLYYITVNLESKSKEEYECGVFDFRNGKNTNTWVSREVPTKVDTFGNVMTVGTQKGIEVYDIRKLVRPFLRENIKGGVLDFLFQPNIGKLFVGCETKLKVYSSSY